MTYEQACANLQAAITLSAQGLKYTIPKAFVQTPKGWVPRPKCLFEDYSSGEAVICAILLSWFCELHGSKGIEIPERWRDKIINSPADIVWPGGWYFTSAINRLSEKHCLEAIKLML